MSISWFENEIYTDLKDELAQNLISTFDADIVIEAISSNFPFRGSKIDWSQLRTTQTLRCSSEDKYQLLKAAITSFQEAAKIEGSSTVSVVWDDDVWLGLNLSISQLVINIEQIFCYPATTYVATQEAIWCLCYETEGYIDFGKSPKYDT